MADSDKVRVCMIGAGGMANQAHYPSITRVKEAQVLALSDLIEDKAKETADRWEIPNVYVDYQKMLEEQKPDAVYVVMPPQHMFEIVMACLRAKANVFVEKPPGLTAYQTRSYARVAKENGVVGMVGFNRRYIPVITRAKAYVEEKGGPVVLCVSSFYKGGSNPSYYDGQVDCIGCDAIHSVDFMRFACGGEVKSVASLVSAHGTDEPNAWQAMVRFDNGASAVLHTFWNSGGRQHLFELHSQGAAAYIDPDGRTTLRTKETKEAEVIENKGTKDRGEMYQNYGHLAQAQHFIDSIREGREPSSSFSDAVKTMDLVDEIRRGDIG